MVPIDYGYFVVLSDASLSNANQLGVDLYFDPADTNGVYHVEWAHENGAQKLAQRFELSERYWVSDTIRTTAKRLSEIDLSTFSDGRIQQRMWVTDAAGNQGETVVSFLDKQAEQLRAVDTLYTQLSAP
ncbi:hypothetical protein RZS08_47745, partial [Arthrospira platensis SPKY1]|nr:hypothetical protein [Arthrospira platensis SPKY1]